MVHTPVVSVSEKLSVVFCKEFVGNSYLHVSKLLAPCPWRTLFSGGMIPMLRSLALGAVVTVLPLHGVIMAWTVTRSLLSGHNAKAGTSTDPVQDEPSTAAADRLRDIVLSMYANCWLDPTILAPQVVFEDPLMRMHGPAEVAEVFRALKTLSPTNLSLKLVTATTHRADFDLRQKYVLPIVGLPMQLSHSVTLRLDLHGAITHIEDRWNGVQLPNSWPFAWARRLNGRITYALTPYLV